MAAAHRRRHRAEVHRDVLGLHEQLAVGGEQGGRAVGPLLDVGAERGPPQHRAHLLGHAGEPGDRGPGATAGSSAHAHVRARRTSAPAAPGLGPPARRAPRSCSRARRPRPARPPARAVDAAAGRPPSSGAARRGPGPQRDHLDRRAGPGVAVAAPVLVGEVGRRSARSARGSAPRTGSRRAVVDLGAAADARARRLAGQLGERVVEPVVVGRRRPRPHQVALAGRAQQPDGRQHPGPRRHDHRRHARARRPARRRAAARRRRRRRAPGRGDRRPARPTPPAAPAPWPRRPPRPRPRRSTPARVERGPGGVDVERGRARGARRRPGCARATRSASVTVGSVAAPAVAGRARVRRRRCSGPTTSAPPGSMRAIEPPPAPMVCTSSDGQPHREAADRRARRAGSGTPPSTRHTSVLVPPMSKVTASGKPLAAATAGAGPHARRPGPRGAGRPGRSAAVGRPAPARRPRSSPAPRRPASARPAQVGPARAAAGRR